MCTMRIPLAVKPYEGHGIPSIWRWDVAINCQENYYRYLDEVILHFEM